MTIPSYQVDAAYEAWRQLPGTTTKVDIREMLEAAFSATPPEEVVPREITMAGLDAYYDEKGSWADRSHKSMAKAFTAMRSARPKVSSEAPVDGACAPCKECDHVWITMICQFDTHETSADWCVKCGKGDNFARHKPRAESTPPDLPIKYQRNVGGVQTISWNTRDGKDRRVFQRICHGSGSGRKSQRRSPKGAA